MKILVTGAAGYIGSVLVPILISNGHEVTALDNFMYNQSTLLDGCHESGLTVVRGDVRNKDLISQYMEDAEAIFPLACLTGAPLCAREPETARAVNLEAIKMLLELRRPDQKVVFPTTNSGPQVFRPHKSCQSLGVYTCIHHCLQM